MPEKNRFPAVLQPFVKSKRAQSDKDDETWVEGSVNPTFTVFDSGDARATTLVTEPHAFHSTAGGHGASAVQTAMQVRRLTPMECERLQGFPDDWTLIGYRGKPASECPDGPRYKAIGNSMAVPCMAWIGRQINKAIGGKHG